MQRTVTSSLINSYELLMSPINSETDGHTEVITVALRCGESVVNRVNRPFAAAYQLAVLHVCPDS